MCNFFCGCCSSKKDKRKVRAFEIARERLQEELNLVDIVLSLRYFERALAHLILEQRRETLRQESQCHIIDPDSDI